MSPLDFTTSTVKVSSQSFFQPEYSSPAENNYVFSYLIRITNEGASPVRLLRRHWVITDATSQIREVEGEGVVGLQPILAPGQSHEYTSWVQFPTPMGTMEGRFLMEQLFSDPEESHRFFQAEIPRFLHIAPELMN